MRSYRDISRLCRACEVRQVLATPTPRDSRMIDIGGPNFVVGGLSEAFQTLKPHMSALNPLHNPYNNPLKKVTQIL